MKTALVFGHTSGLGFAVTKVLLDKKYKVIGFSRSNSTLESEHLENISVDLTKKEDIEKAISIIKEKYSNFDALIYCSGVLTAHDVDKLNYDENEKLYKILVLAPMILESRLLSLVKRNKAYIVNITSSALIEYYPKFAEYVTAKAAMQRFTNHLHNELKGTGARVMEFCPGAFQSNIYKNMMGEKINRNESEQLPPSAYADVLVYLLELPKDIRVPHIFIERNKF